MHINGNLVPLSWPRSPPTRQRVNCWKKERHSLSFSVNLGTETHAQRFRTTDTLREIRSAERWNHSLRKSSVTPAYFQTLGIPLRRGREFTGIKRLAN